MHIRFFYFLCFMAKIFLGQTNAMKRKVKLKSYQGKVLIIPMKNYFIKVNKVWNGRMIS